MTFLGAFLSVMSLIIPRGVAPTQSGQPFSITISTQHEVVKAGSEISVEITLTNTSNHKISLGKAPGNQPLAESEYAVEVYNRKDQLAPDTEYGRKIRQKKIWFRSRDSVSLQPGESTKDGVIISKLYDLSHPGAYTVQLSRVIPEPFGKGGIKSNMITITVTE
jgi:hypothetical protein